jgi:hypothetical protein
VRWISLLSLACGCFYTAPIDQRPSATITGEPSTPLHRGDPLTLTADIDDPEGNAVTVVWSAYGCSLTDCDDMTRLTSASLTWQFDVPRTRFDNVTPVQALYITLDAMDSYGAHARPMPTLSIAIPDLPPEVTMSATSTYSYVIGTPVDFYAKYGDPDDEASGVKLTWNVFTPSSQPTYTLTPLTVQQDPSDTTHLLAGQTLVPQGTGTWTVEVVATDPLGMTGSASQQVTMQVDPPPCLEQWTPIAPPPGDELPLDQATLFEALVVQDDLDPFPPVPGDPILGTTTFVWSLLAPGSAAFQTLAATSNSVALDPADYAPGNVLQLRVEVYDRNTVNMALPCDASDPTCSITGDPSCIQRQTWDVEVQ